MSTSTDCSACVKSIAAKLKFIPSGWRNGFAEVICSLKGEPTVQSCSDIKKCETLTELSPFTVKDTMSCITYKDERGITVERCFDINSILNNVLDNIDPKCVATLTEWSNMSFVERIQAIITSHAICCCGESPTTSTTTTTSSTSTTTHPDYTCTVYSLENKTSNQLSYSFEPCGGGLIVHRIINPNFSVEICAVTDSVSTEFGIVVTEIEECFAPTTTTTSSTTTTTTDPGTTTSTTTTTTVAPPPVCTAYVLKNIGSVDEDYIYTDCNGVTQGGTLAASQSTAAFCALSGTIVAGSNIQIDEFGPCTEGQPCNEYIVTNTIGTATKVFSQDCDTGLQHIYDLNVGQQLVICAVIGSVSVQDCPSCTIVPNGQC